MEVLLKKLFLSKFLQKVVIGLKRKKKHNIHSLTLRKSSEMVKMFLLSIFHNAKKFTYKIIIFRQFGHLTGDWRFESEKNRK